MYLFLFNYYFFVILLVIATRNIRLNSTRPGTTTETVMFEKRSYKDFPGRSLNRLREKTDFEKKKFISSLELFRAP